ncbi:MFS transporter [Paeniglutamicibacter gangotriensis]|uniref:Benzoate transport protein n=1 Tax=Paeniglutamicibacter gangotriensis Lz1y TaxID=1276920 RepID=M7MZ58_9MICC|nr:aromatic acid/H+ symport family MFS transporter [Paeniglutamicibacter gangotriensis]EMR00327.1 benzoate transport protein [Paeniglutamicibacter gangotriensis Lz1y]
MKSTRNKWIVALCWLTVVFEGFDIVALSASIPQLIDTSYAGITALDATFIATISLVGVGAGAVLIGPISDRFGRRVPLMICVLVFSVFTILFPLMPTIALLATVRMIAGLGMGACMPVAITMMQEAAASNARAHSATITMTGYHVGAVAASLFAILAHADWHLLFYIGGALGLVVLPFMWAKLPETHAVGLKDIGTKAPKSSMATLFTGGLARSTIGLWVAAFMGLLLVYGLNTWLPQLMRGAGYNVADSLVLLLILNVGAIAGLLLGGRIADKRGVKGTTMFWFTSAAVLLALLSIRMESQLLLNGVVLVTGFFVFCAQVLVYGFVGYIYPKHVVGTGMGMVAGVGRLGAIAGPGLTGLLVASGHAYPWGFYLFAGAALLGMLAVAIIPKPAAQKDVDEPVLETQEA